MLNQFKNIELIRTKMLNQFKDIELIQTKILDQFKLHPVNHHPLKLHTIDYFGATWEG